IVSDGCSSSKDTDIGARILARAALECIYKSTHGIKVFSEAIMAKAETQCLSLGLEREALDATLLVAVQWEKNVDVFMMGDGLISLEIGDHTELIRAEYPMNMPYYPSYLIDDRNRNLFN